MPLIQRARFLPATGGGIGEGSGPLVVPIMEGLGNLVRHANFVSSYVTARNVDVWLPPRYALEDGGRFPVIYMHDGQNLFDSRTAYAGVDWGIDEAMVRLARDGTTGEAIVVGIWNTGRRFQEYMPQKLPAVPKKALESPGEAGARPADAGTAQEVPLSDAYLSFIVKELKPFVDATYRTLPARQSTYVMGSSMGGLISLYALCEYPETFGGAGCLSTHWPADEGAMLDYLRKALPRPGRHKIYFDYGTETLDASYEVYQVQVDEVMRSAGYTEGSDWITRCFAGAEHSERAWRERVHIPLAFLLAGWVE